MVSKETIQLNEPASPIMGYWSDVSKIQFDEATNSSWIQMMPLGKYNHPIHGTIDITPQKISDFARNFKLNVRGQDLPIDYDHEEKTAAGWLKDIQDRGPSGLWGLVEWSQTAFTQLKDKAYRYFSPTFQDQWQHPQTNILHKNVLFGGAVTNYPFLKGILPINLSEVVDQANEGDSLVDPKELRKLLGLPEDATEANVQAKLTELESKVSDPQKDKKEETKVDPPKDETKAPVEEKKEETRVPVAASENDAEVKRLRETVAKLEATQRLSEIKLKFNEMETGATTVLAPNVRNKIQALAVKLSETDGNTLIEVIGELVKGGLVELGETKGGRPNPTSDNNSATQRFNDAIDKAQRDGKVEYLDAIEAVVAKNPKLYEEYRAEQLSEVH